MQVIGVGAQVARAGEGNGRCRLLCATAMKEEAGGGGAASFVVPVVVHLTTGSEWFDAVPWGVILRRTGTGERRHFSQCVGTDTGRSPTLCTRCCAAARLMRRKCWRGVMEFSPLLHHACRFGAVTRPGLVYRGWLQLS